MGMGVGALGSRAVLDLQVRRLTRDQRQAGSPRPSGQKIQAGPASGNRVPCRRTQINVVRWALNCSRAVDRPGVGELDLLGRCDRAVRQPGILAGTAEPEALQCLYLYICGRKHYGCPTGAEIRY